MPTTSNFGWTTPADTDLVKDGAAAIRTLGNGIDTSLVDLKGGTTGQVLSKNSNTDLDYTWVTPNVGDITEVQAGTGISVASGTGPIPVVTNSMATEITAKGDLIVGTGSGTFDNLAVGTNGHILVADSGEATGLKWAAPAAGGKVLQVIATFKDDTFTSTAGTFADITGLSATITPSSASNKILIISNINIGGTTAVNGSGARLMRGATAIGVGATAGSRTSLSMSAYVGGDDDYVGSLGFVYLDSPATTSATTYKWQTFESTGTTFVNRGQADVSTASQFRSASNIILMEIGA